MERCIFSHIKSILLHQNNQP